MTKVTDKLTIGNVTLENSLILAPMAGYTDVSMRSLCREAGAGLTVTEMVSAKGMVYNSPKSGELLLTADNERVKCVQLFGSEPEFFARAIRLPCLDKFDIIDINMGCPVPKIVRSGEGSSLLNNPDLAAQIVAACVSASGGRPVTVKTRIGYNDGEFTAIRLAKAVENAGAAAITVHGRTKAMGYSGVSNIELVREVKRNVSLPVIASGDGNENNASELIDGVDGLMIGRGAIGNPGVFAAILGKEWNYTLKQTLLRHIELMLAAYGDRYAYVNMRKHIGYYLRGEKRFKELKQILYTINSTDELIKQIDASL